MKIACKALMLLLLGVTITVSAQPNGDDDIFGLMDSLAPGPETEFTYATFKTTRIVNSRSVELPAKGEAQFVIEHRFGRINSGWREFFGIDNAHIRFGLEYGILDWLSIGFGRSSVQGTYDGFFRLRALRQSKGKRKMPFTVTWFSNIAIASNVPELDDRDDVDFNLRVSYANQLAIARKFTRDFSLQIMPTYVHKNLERTVDDRNDVFALGAGMRYLITRKMSINLEYFHMIPGEENDRYFHVMSVGIDIETGGHVFQFMISNSQGMLEQEFLTNAQGYWWDGDIHFGFNINRMFSIVNYEKLKRKKEAKQRERENKAVAN